MSLNVCFPERDTAEVFDKTEQKIIYQDYCSISCKSGLIIQIILPLTFSRIIIIFKLRIMPKKLKSATTLLTQIGLRITQK
jgi:hypothetical protein